MGKNKTTKKASKASTKSVSEHTSSSHVQQELDEYKDFARKINTVISNIAKGNLDVHVEGSYDGEMKSIQDNVSSTVNVLNNLINEMNDMSEQHNAGDIDVKIKTSNFSGAFNDMAKGINDMVFGHIAVKKKAMACVDEFGKGNFDAPLEQFPGKKAFINDTIEKLRQNLKDASGEVNSLVKATKDGKLEVRGDADKYNGDWNTLVGGINDLIDAFVKPINVTATYVDKISKGVIPEEITDTYNGDFNKIKNNLNGTVKMMRELLEETDKIATAAEEGKLETRADA
ncbi:MAG TPA: hypothetical protein VKP59_01690, partial [Candidatus Thermoplasmatota archaeon]|nr:hypothetical protein [Candidatus Thermoplasmatota archaeon]